MAEIEYVHLSERAQVLRLRATALAALAEYPLKLARLRVLYHGYNSTFRVDTTDGRRFALRLAVSTGKTPADLDVEMAWLDALHRDTDLRLPVPQRTIDDRLYTQVWCAPVGRMIPVALFGWLPGTDLDERVGPDAMREVGRITATLHRHSAAWTRPAGPGPMSLRSVLSNLPNRLDDGDIPEFTAERRALWADAFARCQAAIDTWWGRWPTQLLHADIHLGNIKTVRGRLALFDFDDIGIGVPAQDLAITSYYVRGRDDLDNALFEGYSSVDPLPAFTGDEFEAVVAARQLLLLDDVIATENAGLRAIVPRYVANAEVKLRHFLATGTFVHRLDGVTQLW